MSKYFILSLFLFISNSLYSQDYYGLTVGTVRSNFIGSDVPSLSEGKQNFSFGVFLDYYLGEDIFTFYEIQLTKVGARFSEEMPNTGLLTIDAELTQISVPILLRFSYSKQKIKPYFNFGAAPSYLFKNNTTITAVQFGREIDSKLFFDYQNRDINVDGILGIGFFYQRYIIDLKYYYGLRSIYQGDTPLVIRSNALQINFSMILNFDNKKSRYRPD